MSQEYVRTNKKILSPGSNKNKDFNNSDLSRILPRQLSTGSTRGTQTVGYGNTKIDGSNNRITIGTPDGGTIGFGSIPDTTPEEFGFFSTDSDGKLIMKIVDGTFYAYDPESNLNTVQVGILPNGVGGIASANEGYSVSEGF